MRYEIGEYVVYGNNGICQVQDIANPGFSGVDKEKMYYVLEPLNTKGSRIYSPVDNSKVMMRSVMDEEQAEKLIEEIPLIEELWITNDKMREERYKEAMVTGEPVEWVKIIKTLYLRGKDRERQGKKITATDERYLKQAEDSLYGELGFALGKEKAEMESYITDRIRRQKI
nr:CarD family transcriptional regulator [Eubacterium sp.]